MRIPSVIFVIVLLALTVGCTYSDYFVRDFSTQSESYAARGKVMIAWERGSRNDFTGRPASFSRVEYIFYGVSGNTIEIEKKSIEYIQVESSTRQSIRPEPDDQGIVTFDSIRVRLIEWNMNGVRFRVLSIPHSLNE